MHYLNFIHFIKIQSFYLTCIVKNYVFDFFFTGESSCERFVFGSSRWFEFDLFVGSIVRGITGKLSDYRLIVIISNYILCAGFT